MVDKLLWFLGILLVVGVGVGAWWSLNQPTPPSVAGMPSSVTGCPEGTHVVWSRRDGRQCMTPEELRTAAQEDAPARQPHHVIALGPGVSCHDLPTGIACACEGR
jgi:hypothetical protein